MAEEQKSELMELVIVEEEKDALLTALKMCRGDWSEAFKGWKDEGKRAWTDRLLEGVESVQLRFGCPYFPEQMSGIYAGKLTFIRELKPFLIDVLTLYIGGFPDEYGGADYWKKEAVHLICRLKALSVNL
ncbi:MAG: hypothetical protein U9M90_04350 [Patescibacteria group bacterium]|nr:hypothetical protein [Patescibacteria group bacterium]